MNVWRDYMVSMGFGYKLGIDLLGENEDLYLIPFMTRLIMVHGMDFTVVSIAIGQEVNLTPLQIANLEQPY